MNSQPTGSWAAFAYGVGALGLFLIVAVLDWTLHVYTQPPPLGEERAAVRAQALADLRAAETEKLNNAAWLDKDKGLVRLPIQDAMQLVERDWGRNPSAARSNLVARVERATAPPPPAPEKPNPFE